MKHIRRSACIVHCVCLAYFETFNVENLFFARADISTDSFNAIIYRESIVNFVI